MSEVHLRVKIHLHKEWYTDPMVEADIGGKNLDEIIATAKQLGDDLVKVSNSHGVKKIDIVNGHEILGFIDIPI